jgi:hypothetical protein
MKLASVSADEVGVARGAGVSVGAGVDTGIGVGVASGVGDVQAPSSMTTTTSNPGLLILLFLWVNPLEAAQHFQDADAYLRQD